MSVHTYRAKQQRLDGRSVVFYRWYCPECDRTGERRFQDPERARQGLRCHETFWCPWGQGLKLPRNRKETVQRLDNNPHQTPLTHTSRF